MRRCYSTKPIEEVESEIEQKGPEYWKYLLTRALQDKSLDVIEHFCITFMVEGIGEDYVGKIVRGFPYLRFLSLGQADWLLSTNARTLIEIWRSKAFGDVSGAVVAELNQKGVCPILSTLAFGESVDAR